MNSRVCLIGWLVLLGACARATGSEGPEPKRRTATILVENAYFDAISVMPPNDRSYPVMPGRRRCIVVSNPGSATEIAVRFGEIWYRGRPVNLMHGDAGWYVRIWRPEQMGEMTPAERCD